MSKKAAGLGQRHQKRPGSGQREKRQRDPESKTNAWSFHGGRWPFGVLGL